MQVLWFKLFGMFRGWCVLLLILLDLLWVFWGVPIFWVKPGVQLTLNFEGVEKAGQLPPEVKPSDLEIKLEAWDTRRGIARKPPVKAKPVSAKEPKAVYHIVWPKHRMIFGFRWLWFHRVRAEETTEAQRQTAEAPPAGPASEAAEHARAATGRWRSWIGWNGRSRREMPYVLSLSSKNKALDPYDLAAVKGGLLDIDERPAFRRWWITRAVKDVPYKTGATVEVEVALSAVTQGDKEIRITPLVDGKEAEARSVRIREGRAAKVLVPLSTHIPEGQMREVVLIGTAMPSGRTAELTLRGISRRVAPWPARLDFNATQETGQLSIPGAAPTPVPFRFEIYDAEDGTLLKQGGSSGEATLVSVPLTKGEQTVTVKIIVPDDSVLPVPSDNVTLRSGQTAAFPPWHPQPNPDKPKGSPASGAGAPPTPLPLPPLIPPGLDGGAKENALPQPVRPAP